MGTSKSTLYVDPPFDPRPFARRAPFNRRSEAAHLSADTIEELCTYLAAQRFPTSYLHRPKSYGFHYDLYGCYLASTLHDPRVERVSRQEYVRRLAGKRKERDR